ncbi:MFS transporter [Chloroflexota bacterium]
MNLPTDLPRYRWVILVLAWLAYAISYMGRLSIGPLGPFLKEAFDLTNTQFGSLAAAPAILYSPTLIVAGLMADRFGVKKVLTTGTAFLGLCMLLVYIAPTYQSIMVILILSGLGAGTVMPTTIKALMAWFPARERATAIGFNQTGVNAGGILGAVLLPVIALAIGWRHDFLIVGLSILSISLLIALLYRNPPAGPPGTAAATDAASAMGLKSFAKFILNLFKSRDMWCICLTGFLLCTVEFAVIAHLVNYLAEVWLIAPAMAGLLLAMTEASGAVGKPGTGFVSDYLLKGQRKVVLLALTIISTVACFSMGIFGGEASWLLYPILVMLGIATIGWGGIVITMAGELGGHERAGTLAGTISAVIIMGSVVGPFCFGLITDVTGSFDTAWLFMGFISLLAIVTTLMTREAKKV